MTLTDLAPTSSQANCSADSRKKAMLNKVPEVTIYFWIIKVLCTTVGETASDFLNVTIGLGLTGTSILMGALLLVVLYFQFKAGRYIPGIYWLAVVLISVFGTLITDNLTDSMGVPLEISTAVFSFALALTFVVWYAREGTLSIHTIFTRRRELFYWSAILFTFALGTAAGDLMAESLGLGYLVTGIIVCATIAAIGIAWRFNLDPVLSFWIAYILTRPLGASFGDYLSQSQANGGLGLGASSTTAVFMLAILAVIIFLSITRRDSVVGTPPRISAHEKRLAVVWQVVVVVAVMVAAAGSGYHWRRMQLINQARISASPNAPLGDLSVFSEITKDTLGLVAAGDLVAAKSRVGDLESAWDNAAARIKPVNPEKWSSLDDSIDNALRTLRAARQDAGACKSSLKALLGTLNSLDSR